MAMDPNFKKFLKDVVKKQSKTQLTEDQKKHLEENAGLTTLVAVSTICARAISSLVSLLRCYDKIDFNDGVFLNRDFNRTWRLYYMAPPFINFGEYNPTFIRIITPVDKTEDNEKANAANSDSDEDSIKLDKKQGSLNSSYFYTKTMMISNAEALLKYWKSNKKPTIIHSLDDVDDSVREENLRTVASLETTLLCSMFCCVSFSQAFNALDPLKFSTADRVLKILCKKCEDDPTLFSEWTIKQLVEQSGRCIYLYQAIAQKYGFEGINAKQMLDRKIGTRMIRAAIELDSPVSLINSYCEHLLQAVEFIMEMNLRMPDIIADHLSKGVVIFTDPPDEPK